MRLSAPGPGKSQSQAQAALFARRPSRAMSAARLKFEPFQPQLPARKFASYNRKVFPLVLGDLGLKNFGHPKPQKLAEMKF